MIEIISTQDSYSSDKVYFNFFSSVSDLCNLEEQYNKEDINQIEKGASALLNMINRRKKNLNLNIQQSLHLCNEKK